MLVLNKNGVNEVKSFHDFTTMADKILLKANDAKLRKIYYAIKKKYDKKPTYGRKQLLDYIKNKCKERGVNLE